MAERPARGQADGLRVVDRAVAGHRGRADHVVLAVDAHRAGDFRRGLLRQDVSPRRGPVDAAVTRRPEHVDRRTRLRVLRDRVHVVRARLPPRLGHHVERVVGGRVGGRRGGRVLGAVGHPPREGPRAELRVVDDEHLGAVVLPVRVAEHVDVDGDVVLVEADGGEVGPVDQRRVGGDAVQGPLAARVGRLRDAEQDGRVVAVELVEGQRRRDPAVVDRVVERLRVERPDDAEAAPECLHAHGAEHRARALGEDTVVVVEAGHDLGQADGAVGVRRDVAVARGEVADVVEADERLRRRRRDHAVGGRRRAPREPGSREQPERRRARAPGGPQRAGREVRGGVGV